MSSVEKTSADAPGQHGSVGPDLLDVKMHLVTPASPVVGRVVSNERCTAGRGSKSASIVRHVSIDVSGTALAGQIHPGQSLGVLAPGTDARGLPNKLRLYSIASPTAGEDGAGNVIATTVKRTIDEHWETGSLFLGACSNYLCDLKVGDEVRVTGPSGKRFVLPRRPGEHDYVFFATGTGIAPFRGMILELLRANVESKIVLVMGSAYSTDLLYHADLLALAAKHSNFRYLTAISRESQGNGEGPAYVQDRLSTHAGELVPLLSGPRGLVYVCGIAGMELGIVQGLATVLDVGALEGYLAVDPEMMSSVGSWDRRMLHKQVRPTRRMFFEVY